VQYSPQDAFLLYHKSGHFNCFRVVTAVFFRNGTLKKRSYKYNKSFIDFRAGINENKERWAPYPAPRKRIFRISGG